MTKYSLILTRDRLAEVLSFNAETGLFTWVAGGGCRKAGDIAGGLNTHGYRTIGVDGHIYHAHRLVWLFTYGEWPARDIDHKDRNRDNNRPSNLRLATEAENQWNTPAPKDNTSGHKGVYAHQGRWMALIQKNKARKYLGRFASFEDACAAYDNAAKLQHGDFYREGC